MVWTPVFDNVLNQFSVILVVLPFITFEIESNNELGIRWRD